VTSIAPAIADVGRVQQMAVTLTRQLIALDTSNTEQAAAALIADRLAAAGGNPQVLAGKPGRDNVVLRIPGRFPGPGLVVHAHLDTVPADPARWTVDPWAGEIRDGCIWGLGAVDMKSSAAMMAAVAQEWLVTGVRPRHDVVLAFLADEETGGTWGARWLTERRPDLFDGCDTAIGEVGGFAVPLRSGRTMYPVMTAERGHAVVEMVATGNGGHSGATAGSASRAEGDPLTTLAAVVATIGTHEFERFTTTAAAEFVAALAAEFGLPPGMSPTAVRAMIGPLTRLIEGGERGSAVPTLFAAGHAPNVTATRASATVDCRFVPGHADEFLDEIRQLVPGDVQLTITVLSPGFDRGLVGRTVPAMTAALRRADRGAMTVPYGVAASTDGPAFAALGLQPFGFTPLALPAGFPYGRLFHGVDERVPVAAVEFGVAVLADFLATV